MSEEQNIPDEQKEISNEQSENVNENPQPESAEPLHKDSFGQTINYSPQTENMEVHKHPHHVTHKKKWGEYLLEFFMLFFAVFLGFVAENIRENTVEKHREKQFMVSLVKDLELDTSELSKSDNFRLQKIRALDTAIHIFSNTRYFHGTFYSLPFI